MKKSVPFLLVVLGGFLAAAAGGTLVFGLPALRRRALERSFCERAVAAAEAGEFERVTEIWERFRADFRSAFPESPFPEPWLDCEPPTGGIDPDDPNLLLVAPAGAGITVTEPAEYVRTTRPTIRWIAPPGERRYRVTILSRGAGFQLDRETAGNELPYPPEDAPLLNGAQYTVSVSDTESRLGAGHAPFGVAWSDRIEATDRALELLRERLGTGAAFRYFAGNLFHHPREPERRFLTSAVGEYASLSRRFPRSRLLHELLAVSYRSLGLAPLLAGELDVLRGLSAPK